MCERERERRGGGGGEQGGYPDVLDLVPLTGTIHSCYTTAHHSKDPVVHHARVPAQKTSNARTVSSEQRSEECPIGKYGDSICASVHTTLVEQPTNASRVAFGHAVQANRRARSSRADWYECVDGFLDKSQSR